MLVILFGAPTCLASILWFYSAVAVSMREAAKPFIFEAFKADCDAVLRGRRGTWSHSLVSAKVSKVVLRDRRNTLARFPEDELHFWMCTSCFYVAGAALPTCRTACLCDLHCHGCVKRRQLGHCMACAGHCERVFCLESATSGLDASCLESHFARQAQYLGHPYTPHFTLYTPHFALHTPHFTL